MEWSKIKTVIIVILLILNAVLLFLLVRDTVSKRSLHENALRDLHTVMENNGVTLAADALPGAEGVYALTSGRDGVKEGEIAAKLLGESIMEDRGGNIHYYYSALGEAYFRGTGDFELILFAADEAAADGLRELLGGYGITLPAGLYGSTVQIVGGLPVFDCPMTVEPYEGGIRAAGRWLISATAADPERPAIDAPTALVRFISEMNLNGYICTEVSKLELAYSMTALVAGDFELTPVWRITTDTGNYDIDGVTGALRKQA